MPGYEKSKSNFLATTIQLYSLSATEFSEHNHNTTPGCCTVRRLPREDLVFPRRQLSSPALSRFFPSAPRPRVPFARLLRRCHWGLRSPATG
ncbi:hypothetical protein Dimus_033703 [Dionaea muscipula]